MYLSSFAMWQFMIITVYGQLRMSMSQTRKCNFGPRKTLILEFDAENVRRTITVRRVERALANEFLPVWITTNRPDMEFEKLDIMGKIGNFTTYHDDCTKSAFVYFNDRLELDGVIDVTYYVKGLPIDETKRVHFIEPRYLHRVRSSGFLSRLIRSANNTVMIGTRSYEKQKVYPELLVAISHQTFMAIEQDSDLSRGIATVSHMVTAYNAADMLYKLIRSVDVQLNMAGIVIEGIPNQWSFETKSYWGFFEESYIDVNTIHQKISEYFWHKPNHFPQHSYDYIIYHTRNPLKDESTDVILGQAMPSTDGYMFPPDSHEDRFNAVVKDFATYEHFTTIAHEIAHFFRAKHDGEGPYSDFFDVKTCEHSLMAVKAHCSLSCLRWSQQTEVEFAEFFRMPVHCNLKNYPRSLAAPRPKVIFSGNEQCRCYGFQYKVGCKDYISETECGRPLVCVNQYINNVEKVPLPMDGTPCGPNKVCWNNDCVNF